MATITISNTGGNWSSTGTWVGGSVPATTDDIAATATSGNLTVDNTTIAQMCRHIDFTNYVGTLTIATGKMLIWGGNLKFVSGMTLSGTGQLLNFYGNGTLTSASLAIPFTLQLGIYTFTLADNWDINGNLTNNAAVTINGYQINVAGNLQASGGSFSGTTAIVLDGTGTWSSDTATYRVGNPLTINTAGTITLGANTALIGNTFTYTAGTVDSTTNSGRLFIQGSVTLNSNGMSWNQITVNASSTLTLGNNFRTLGGSFVISGTFTHNNKTVEFASPDVVTLSTGLTFYNLTRTGTASQVCGLQINGDITVTNNFTITGNAGLNRVYVCTNVRGTQHTITCTGASKNFTNVDFEDIIITGGTQDTTSLVGDCQNNTGITFTTGAPMYYQHTGSGNVLFSTLANWYLGDNGGGGTGRIPLPQDTATFTAASFDTNSKTITQDLARVGGITFAAIDNTETFTTTTVCTVYGSLILSSNLTVSASTQAYTMAGRTTDLVLNCAGKNWSKTFTFDSIVGKYTLQNAGSFTATITLKSGGLDFNDCSFILSALIDSGTMAREIWLGDGNTITFTAASFWALGATTTLHCETCTIKTTSGQAGAKTFAGGGKTYYNYWDAATGVGEVTITGSNTFNDIKINPDRILYLTGGTTQIIASLTATGTSGHLCGLKSSNTTRAIISKSSGTVSNDYMNIDYIEGSQTNMFYVGTHTSDTGNNVNVYFSAPGSGTVYDIFGIDITQSNFSMVM